VKRYTTELQVQLYSSCSCRGIIIVISYQGKKTRLFTRPEGILEGLRGFRGGPSGYSCDKKIIIVAHVFFLVHHLNFRLKLNFNFNFK
jgi:hypothetical protein